MGTSEPAQRMPVATADGTGRSRGAKRILVVDDNEDSRLALRALLESMGYVVHEAADGQEAVQRTREIRPHLVLMDIMMPRMDGLEATRRIRATPELAETPIVCVSAMEGAAAASREAGSDDCVLKPIYDLTAFGDRVAGWLCQEASQ